VYYCLNNCYYHRFKGKQEIAAVRAAFVEIQAPILDTKFFTWFLDEVRPFENN
jgi:hypothetical protein